jgi:hypothetical protein
MKRAVLLSTLAVLLPLSALRADEPPEVQLEFARKLREKGYANLALEHLEKLQKAPPAGLDVAKLPLELARARISLARQKDPAERVSLFNKAKTDLEAFVAANPKSPEAPQVRVELARLEAYKGQALLGQALRQEDPKNAEGLKRQAEGHFIKAGEELKKAAEALPDAQARAQILFERARNFFDQAETHPFDRQRAKLVGAAQKALEEVEKIAIKDNSDPTLHLARAWLYPSYQKGDDPTKAALYFRALMREDEPAAQAGQRLAWYFRIRALVAPAFEEGASPAPPLKKVADFGRYARFLPKDHGARLASPKNLALAETEAAAWLKAFPRAVSGPEGQGVRYELARALLGEAREISARVEKGKDPKAPKGERLSVAAQKELTEKAGKLYDRAERQFAEVAASQNDFTEKASQLSLDIRFLRMGPGTLVDRLRDFDQCYLKARYEMRKMGEAALARDKAAGEQRAALEKQRRQHLSLAIAAFRRGLELADDATPFQQAADARFFLTYMYLLSGDPYRAAVLGEDLARSNNERRSADAAGYALQAYGSIAAATKQEADRKRMRDLVRFIESQPAWKDAAVANLARYELARAAILDKKPLDAVKLLEGISDSYPAYLYTQAHLVVVATGAARKEGVDPKDRQALLAKAQAALARLPQLSDGADPVTAQMYFAAQLEKGQMLYTAAFEQSRKKDLPAAAKAYAELGAFQAGLQKQYGKHARRFPEEAQDQFATALARMRNLARYGFTRTEHLAGHYDQVLAPAAAGDVVAEVKKTAGKGAEPIRTQDPRLIGEILGYAMRAEVQKGRIPAAVELLRLLQRLADGDAPPGSLTGPILRAIVHETEAQRRELEKSKEVKKVAEMNKNFSAFFDEVVRESKDVSAGQLALLASLYSSQNEHAKAVKIFAQIPDPKIPVQKTYTDAEKRELEEYWQAQVGYGRELRLTKEPAAARKVLARVLTSPQAHSKIKFFAEKELVQLLEDEGQWAKGANAWSKLMGHSQIKAELQSIRETATKKGGKDRTEQELQYERQVKETYFDCYYHFVYCNLMYGKNHKVAGKKSSFGWGAVQRVLRLRKNAEAWGYTQKAFVALLNSEPFFAESVLTRAKEVAGKGKDATALQEAVEALIWVETNAAAGSPLVAQVRGLLDSYPALREEHRRQKGAAAAGK